MHNEEKVLSILERIAGEFQGFKQEVNGRFDDLERHIVGLDKRMTGLEQRVIDIEENMVTKDDLRNVLADSQQDINAMLNLMNDKLDKQSEKIDAKFAVLNDRLFNQETEVQLLKMREA